MSKVPSRPSSRNAFRIAIICALSLEAEMVEYMFDHFWDDEGSTYGKAAGDQNAYTTGMIGNHNVVLTYMPEIGSNSAATIAAGLRSSFRGINVTFVVGVCGVVPIHRQTKEEIVLGDCMISTAVIQYDFGRQYPQGFVSKNVNNSSGVLNTEIKSLISMLKTRRNRERLNKRLAAHLKALQATRPDLKYPGVQRDRLFESSYLHQHYQGGRCDSCLNDIQVCLKDCDSIGCANGLLVERQRLRNYPISSAGFEDVLPQVHFGRFGSANTVMRSGLDRDRISEENELVAFEMEGSGVWNNFPTVLVKSACDYSDSHKSKEWQPYAAATSAAGLKALLERWEVTDEVLEAEISDISVVKEKQLAKQQTFSGSSRYIIPLQRNKRFVGRESQLQELEDRLLIHQECQQLAIYGLGGVGKTQITLEFCYTVKARYPNYSILWVSLISEARFMQDYSKLAKMYSLPIDDNDNLITIVQDYLSSEIAGKWLMVVDNVDDKKLIFEDTGHGSLLDKLPRNETSIILFNTRFKDIAFDVADGNIINLDKMDHKEAKMFLSKSIQNDRLIQDESLVDELLQELTYLPLAIAQASSYIVKTSITISKYLGLMKNTEKETVELLSRDFRDHTRDKESQNAIAITWLVSFDQIRDEEPFAAEILFFLSCIENKAIPLSILPSGTSNVERTNAIGVLLGYSFLSEQENDMYDMHRLVHLAVKIWMQKRDLTQLWKEKAVSHLVKICPDSWGPRAIWRSYITHIIRILQDTIVTTTENRVILGLLLGDYLSGEGRYSEAFAWISDCVSKCESMPEENEIRLRAQHRLATVSISNQRGEEAMKMMQHAVKISERVFPENHWGRLSLQNALAMLYLEAGQIDKAIEMTKKNVATASKMLEVEYPLRITFKFSLAAAYAANNQHEEAMELLQELVAIAPRHFEEDHPTRLACQHALGLAYIQTGRGKDAVEVLQKVVAIEDELPPEGDQRRLTTQHALACAFESCGEIEKAISVMKNVVSTSQKYLSATHPDRIAAQVNLARMLNTYHDR